MKWHCLADSGRYCNGTPEWEVEPTQYSLGDGTPTHTSGGSCKLTPETCGRCQSLIEQLDPVMLEKISKATYVHTVIPIKEEEKPDKPKSAKTRKLEAEMAQRSMF